MSDTPVEVSDLDALQNTYKSVMEEWVTAIRQEEALATVDHDVADVDQWEAAGDREEDARAKVKAAKKAYEDALRKKFFNF